MTTTEKDINDVFDDLLLSEETFVEQGYEEGIKAGSTEGNVEGYHLGYHRGIEIGAELGYYFSTICVHLSFNEKYPSIYADKVVKQLAKLKESIEDFPKTNSEEVDIHAVLDQIRGNFRRLCSLLKIDNDRLKMDEMKIKLLQKQIDNTFKYLKPLLPLANCHMVEFITSDHWNSLIPSGIIQEFEKFGAESTINAFWDIRKHFAVQYNQKEGVVQARENVTAVEVRTKFKNLGNFIEEANRNCLKADGVVCLTVDQLRQQFKDMGARDVESLKMPEFMSDKKSHEVEVLSSIVAMLASCTEVNYTIELGGGKGFLATMLNMLYNMPVLNIDCSEINAKGAEDRKKKLQKQWTGLKKKAEDSKLGIVSERKGRFHKNKEKCKPTIDNLQSQGSINAEINVLENPTLIANQKSNVLEEQILNLSMSNRISVDKARGTELYRHVTEFITQDTDLLKHVKYEFPDHPSDVNLCLTGLHTCGDLGSASVKLFTKCSSSSLLCAVPCCYHLLTERMFENQLSETNESLQYKRIVGFPMSDYLKDFTIGRNARMLASQSVERVSDSQALPADSLFYRALLQVLLKMYYNGETLPEGKIKGLSNKCSDFSEYLKFAIKKLKVDPNFILLSNEELKEFERVQNRHKETLPLFYLLRMCLAPVIESLILLDRLMFLAENGFIGDLGDAFLVKMFDPIVSPRCHAMVAYRKMFVKK